MIYFKFRRGISPIYTMCAQVIQVIEDNYLLDLIASFLSCLKNFSLVSKGFCRAARAQKLRLECSVKEMILFSKHANVYSLTENSFNEKRNEEFVLTLYSINLQFSANAIQGSNFKNLRELVLTECDISPKKNSISFLKHMKNLHTFTLHLHAVITDVSALGSLENLRVLDLSMCKLLAFPLSTKIFTH